MATALTLTELDPLRRRLREQAALTSSPPETSYVHAAQQALDLSAARAFRGIHRGHHTNQVAAD